MLADLRELHEPICELVRVVKEFARKFAEAKRERGIIDFADMEHLTLDILETSPAVAESYRNKFKFIMVDEYQDTNGVQEAIVQKISSTRRTSATKWIRTAVSTCRRISAVGRR